ncbi:MAG: Calx-beta domain-containing protein, partial [Gammaproteobacteria bacterium]
GFDYDFTSGSVTFAAGETQKSVPVAIIDDIDPEPSEDFRLQVTVPAVGTVSATATIIDDDSVPPVLLPLKPMRTRFYAPDDIVTLAIEASEPDGTDITGLVTWLDDSGNEIGNGGVLSVAADAIWNTRGQHHITARVVEQSSGLGLDAMLEFPVVIEDVVVYGADSILDGFDERVVIPGMARGDIAVVLEPYAT